MAVIIKDMKMPKHCYECEFGKTWDNEHHLCSRKPNEMPVPDDEDRPEFCPLKESEENLKLSSYKCCGECVSMLPHGDNFYCHTESITSKHPEQDISTIFVQPDGKPDWCPLDKMNKTLDEMPADRREEFDKVMAGLNALFGNKTFK